MSISVELDAALEASLRERARIAGVSLEEYVRKLAEQDVAKPSKESRLAALSILESFRGRLGPVPERALDPELLYGDS